MGPPSRKYVDLIYKASGKYANWDPPQNVEVGDWGEIDRMTGSFIREGNIFSDPECGPLLSDDTDTEPVKTGPAEDVLRITAGVESNVNNDLYTSLGATGELGVRIQAAWEFTARKRAAVLTLTDGNSHYLEEGVIFPKLRTFKKLVGKAVVVETLHCPAYALLLTDKGKGGKASLSLHTRILEAGTGVGGGTGLGWKFSTESGVWRTACGYRENLEGPNAVYTPLFRLKKVPRSWFRTRYRGSGAGATLEEPVVEEYPLPWEELDEDGNEIVEDSPISPEY